MDVKHAYDLICNFLKERPRIAKCRDYDDYYGFLLAPPNYRSGSAMLIGNLDNMVIVDKKTEKVFRLEDSDLNLRRKMWFSVDVASLLNEITW